MTYKSDINYIKKEKEVKNGKKRKRDRIKNWKREGNYFINTQTNEILKIMKHRQIGEYFVLSYKGIKKGKPIRIAKTKAEAIKIAKDYMKQN